MYYRSDSFSGSEGVVKLSLQNKWMANLIKTESTSIRVYVKSICRSNTIYFTVVGKFITVV
jgi:hypothetical protein